VITINVIINIGKLNNILVDFSVIWVFNLNSWNWSINVFTLIILEPEKFDINLSEFVGV
jgi:hypothetical protein